MNAIMSFSDAITASNGNTRHLLLGNGFSIALRPSIFTYGSLLSGADFRSRGHIPDLFKSLDTVDFELVARFLDDASFALPVYGEISLANRVREDGAYIKEALVKSVAGNHPARPSEVLDGEVEACRQFLSHFVGLNEKGRVYSLNYDLLLYWVLMRTHSSEGSAFAPLSTEDGFGRDEFTAPEYVQWMGETSSHSQRIHYLHGALHLFDAGAELIKYTWANTQHALVDQAREAIAEGRFPLFVAEGRTEQKLEKIRHSAYLHHNLKSFAGIAGVAKCSLFVYGHSLADNDAHILRKIEKGRLRELYVGVHGDPKSDANRALMSSANGLRAGRQKEFPLDVNFFDSASANVWGTP